MAWPEQKIYYDETLKAMSFMLRRLRKLLNGYGEYAHPVELVCGDREDMIKAGDEAVKE